MVHARANVPTTLSLRSNCPTKSPRGLDDLPGLFYMWEKERPQINLLIAFSEKNGYTVIVNCLMFAVLGGELAVPCTRNPL